MNQELKDIYIEIAKKITNNYEEDIKYIAGQIEIYRDHEKNTDIIRRLGILYYDLLPEDNKEDLVKVIQMNEDNVHLLFYIAQYLVSQREMKKAHDILRIVVGAITSWEVADSTHQYYSFDNLVELLLYAQDFDPQKEILRSKYPFHDFYRSLAAIEFSQKNPQAALVFLKQGLLHNPVDVDLLLESAEVYLALGDQEQFLVSSKEALKYTYEVEPLARCYRNIGSYYLQEKDYETATASYYMSLVFDKNELALKALYRVYELTKKELETPDLDEIKLVLEKEKLQVGASTLVVDTLLQLAKEYDEMSERQDAIYYLEMAHRLTNDDSLLDVIGELKATMEVSAADVV